MVEFLPRNEKIWVRFPARAFKYIKKRFFYHKIVNIFMNWFKKLSNSNILGFWVAPNGTMTPVTKENGGHVGVGDEILKKVFKKEPSSYEAYDFLYDNGYVRIYFHQYQTHIDSKSVLTSNQINNILSYFKINKTYDITVLVSGVRSQITPDNLVQLESALKGQKSTGSKMRQKRDELDQLNVYNNELV